MNHALPAKIISINLHGPSFDINPAHLHNHKAQFSNKNKIKFDAWHNSSMKYMETLKCITRTYSHDKVFQNVLVTITYLDKYILFMSGSNPDITPIVGFKRGLVTGDLSTKSVGRSFKNSCLKRTAAP